MLYLAIVMTIAAVFLLTRLLSFKKEVRKISKQLQTYNNRKTNKKINGALLDKDIENLSLEINKLIDLHVKESREKIRFEKDQKQTIANMSHDLRTPLTSILGYIQMAESDSVTEEQNAYLSIASKKAKRLESLLNDFFELSVIESTDHHLTFERINIRNLTIDGLMHFYGHFNERNIEPIITMPENDVYIIADESAITRIIENLCSNAVSHSNGNIMISLEEADSTVRLVVKNDAHTLTENDAVHLFDRFYMADRSRSGKSTGLGLSIVKSFMDKMNGTVTANLKDGQLAIVCEWKAAENK
ncbi:sensor histidine kinase KdpD [Lentibacillus sp. CBA3610]|uniref:sensor histidine kinase n=1 Tax=Lentibacillus sp. CBA3610 TaxID=2518176 RepID=UPI001595D647|nr:HAMP domain-containing sensor histidine kinase [Lentibacillus sp. CBA3610]QKY68404.1 HAMP domain-containing histidine kinase [Lentibacillus sp. CBA3610]